MPIRALEQWKKVPRTAGMWGDTSPQILKSKLNSGNVVCAINSRAVSLLRYALGVINKEALRVLDRTKNC